MPIAEKKITGLPLEKPPPQSSCHEKTEFPIWANRIVPEKIHVSSACKMVRTAL
ncbi:MAG: hypothetical protein KKA54_16960 [Proteobacteria bacterium]|nr:hypothetical protein [Pseudomonadota bacterium]